MKTAMPINEIKSLFAAIVEKTYDPFKRKAPHIPATEDGDYGHGFQIEFWVPKLDAFIMAEFDWYYSERYINGDENGPGHTDWSNQEIDELRLLVPGEDGDLEDYEMDAELRATIVDYIKTQIVWG